MKPVAFDYVRPRDLASALSALREGGDECRVLAGGQSLGPMLNLRIARPTLVVDIGRIDALRGVERDGDSWRVGATTTHAMLEDGAGGIDAMIRSVARGIAYRAVRNRGTVGGSLAHADPAADWPLALSALGAIVEIRSGSRGAARSGRHETRDIAVANLSAGAFSTCLETDEILTAIRIPALSAGMRWGYAKACRKAGEFAEAAAAVVIDSSHRRSRVVVGALGSPPLVIDDPTPLFRAGAASDLAGLEAAVSRAAPDLDAIAVRIQAGTLSRALRQAGVT